MACKASAILIVNFGENQSPSCVRMQSLTKTMARRRKPAVIAPSHGLEFQCPHCTSRIFGSRKGLITHIGIKHPLAGKKRRRNDADADDSYDADDDDGMGALSSSESSSTASERTSTGSNAEASEALLSESENDSDGTASHYSAVGAPIMPAVGAQVPPQVPPAGAVRPIDTGIHAMRKIADPVEPLSFTQRTFGGLIYENASNAFGDKLIAAVKDPRFDASELPVTAKTLKSKIEAAVFKTQPLFKVTQTTVPSPMRLESRDQPAGWRSAKVTSRGVAPCLMSILMNDAISWNDLMQFVPGAAPPAVADEPFYGTVCQEGMAKAILRGTASGEFAPGDVFGLPILHSIDGVAPDLIGKTTLTPGAINLLSLPLEIRRRFDVGQHVCLFPSFPMGHTKSPKLKRDQRRWRQSSYQVFADEFNDVYKRGFILHGSQIKDCPHDRPLLFMPFGVGSAFDAEGTAKHHPSLQ